MPQKDVDRMANSLDPDQTASSLTRIYTVCSDIYIPIFRIFTVSRSSLHAQTFSILRVTHVLEKKTEEGKIFRQIYLVRRIEGLWMEVCLLTKVIVLSNSLQGNVLQHQAPKCDKMKRLTA